MFTNPKDNVQQFEFKPGDIVADFGAGSGAYALEAARAVGDHGKVFAIDIQKDMLARLKNHAKAENLHNIEIIWGDLEEVGGTKLKDGAVDSVVISNILFQAEHKEKVIEEARRILRPKGRVLVVDWTGSFGGLGPTDAAVISEDQMKKMFADKQFAYVWNIAAGAHHYGMIFAKK